MNRLPPASSIHLEMEQVIIDQGVELNSQTEWGKTPAHFIGQHQTPELLKYYVQKGGKLNIKDNSEWLPIHQIYRFNNEKMIECGIELGMDPNSLTKSGVNAKHLREGIFNLRDLRRKAK